MAQVDIPMAQVDIEYIYIYMYIYIYICIFIYTYMYTYIHIYIYVYTYIYLFLNDILHVICNTMYLKIYVRTCKYIKRKNIHIYICMSYNIHNIYQYVPHNAVAEVSKIGNL